MCGLTGVCGVIQADQMNQIVRMMELIRHRGPDGHGIMGLTREKCLCRKTRRGPILPVEFPHVGEAGTLLGHVRLAILDLSDSGLQPLSCPENKAWIIFNGEIYNHVELRRELTALGHSFRTRSDTEVLLAAYLEWGPKMFSRLDGMYAFAIADAHHQTLFCARDRFGEKPFYYCIHNGSFWFASEIKALLAIMRFCKANLHSLASYMVNSKTHFGEETFFSDIHQLPASCWMEVPWQKPNEYKITRYYQLSDSNINHHTDDLISAFREHLTHSVKLRLRADVPVGSCLSGGLDSSSIVSISLRALEAHRSLFHAFTAIPDVPGYSELSWAGQVMENKRGFLHEVHISAENLVSDLDDFLYCQDEPVSGLSVYLQYRVMKAANEHHIPVLLDGQGGDELLLGYERLYALYLLQTLFTGNINKATHEFHQFTKNGSIAPSRLAALLIYSIPPMRRYWRSLGYSGYLIPEISNLISENDPRSLNIFEAQRYEIRVEPLPELLRVEDRNAMRFAVETRLPFLDHKIVEFCLQSPIQCKLNQGWTKWMLRKAMDGIMPSPITWRKDKKGFESPDRIWMDHLKEEMKQILGKSSLSADLYLNRDLWHTHQNLISRNPKLAWRMFCLEKWMHLFHVGL
ncbi:asparagine synthase (glutamine-hydrolyzing) [bacterium]|nr:asparagine synthase (glutamine-hydrolyzing) [bacterium]